LIDILITDEMRKNADRKAKAMGTLKRSIMEGKRNFVGFLGEEMILRSFDGFDEANTFDYDLLLDGEWRIDVKTKQVTSKPKPNYECSLGTYYRQQCDLYVFTRILSTFDSGWILGYMAPVDYYAKATYIKKGTYDKTNDFTFRADSYNLPINDLSSFLDLF